MGVWQARIKVGSTTSFPLLERRLKINRIDLPDNIKTCIIQHLEIVSAEFRSYFNDNTLQVSWYRDLFNTGIDLNAEEAEQLAEFKVSNAMKLVFNDKTPSYIYIFFKIHLFHQAVVELLYRQCFRVKG